MEDLGRYKEHIAMGEMSVRLDPLSRVAMGSFVIWLINRNRLAEADREIEKISTTKPLPEQHLMQSKRWPLIRLSPKPTPPPVMSCGFKGIRKRP